MKKILGILFLSLLLSGNAYAEKLAWNCTESKDFKWIDWQLDLKTNRLSSQWQNKSGTREDLIARVISSGDNYVIVQNYNKSQKKWNTTVTWKFDYSGNIFTEYMEDIDYYGNCKKTSLNAGKPKKEILKKLTREQWKKDNPWEWNIEMTDQINRKLNCFDFNKTPYGEKAYLDTLRMHTKFLNSQKEPYKILDNIEFNEKAYEYSFNIPCS